MAARNKTVFLSCAFALALISAALLTPRGAAAQDAPARKGCILLIDYPKLWSEPRANAHNETSTRKAGLRIDVLGEAKLNDADTSATRWLRVSIDDDDGWIPAAYVADPPQQIERADLKTIGAEPVDRYHGLPSDYEPGDLVSIGPRFDKEIDNRLRAEPAAAHEKMLKAAEAEGVHLMVVSGYRAWSKQQRIYQGKLERSGWNQDTVAKPGHSEHQLGCAVDYTDGDEKTLLEISFGESKAGRWLHDHAWEYGFAVSYTERNRAKTGYAPEPWHYRYWGSLELAKQKQSEATGEAKNQ